MCEIARSQAALMAKFAKFRRLRRLNFANSAMRAAWLRLVRTQLPLGTIDCAESVSRVSLVWAAVLRLFDITNEAAAGRRRFSRRKHDLNSFTNAVTLGG